MLHVVVRGDRARIFRNGISGPDTIPFDCDVPPGHYELCDAGDGYTVSGLTARNISEFAVNGSRYGIRARWQGYRVAINGFAAPLSSYNGTLRLDDLSAPEFSVRILTVMAPLEEAA